ncbi:MAG: hypothetical protein J07HB67_01590 [halophilic archaeon J07HB67]|nr:MAG: hypothetical protein J07HB67_01590 [halophilic archaeon J07HB67]
MSRPTGAVPDVIAVVSGVAFGGLVSCAERRWDEFRSELPATSSEYAAGLAGATDGTPRRTTDPRPNL